MIEKILERLEELESEECGGMKCKDCPYDARCNEGEFGEKAVIENCKKIIQDVAKEYGKDTNVCSYEDGYADGWNDCSHTKAYQKGE